MPSTNATDQENLGKKALSRYLPALPGSTATLFALAAVFLPVEPALALPNRTEPVPLTASQAIKVYESPDHQQLALLGRGRTRGSTAVARKVNPLSHRGVYWSPDEQERELKAERNRAYQRQLWEWQRRKEAERRQEQQRRKRKPRRR